MPAPHPPSDIFLPQPTPEGIEKFKALYKERFGEEIDPQKALELATRTLHFVYLGLNPPPRPVVELIKPRQAGRRRPKRAH